MAFNITNCLTLFLPQKKSCFFLSISHFHIFNYRSLSFSSRTKSHQAHQDLTPFVHGLGPPVQWSPTKKTTNWPNGLLPLPNLVLGGANWPHSFNLTPHTIVDICYAILNKYASTQTSIPKVSYLYQVTTKSIDKYATYFYIIIRRAKSRQGLS